MRQTRTNTSLSKVFVGMSGGVDSSVAAALLKKAGYDVTGVFIKVWQPDWIECDWREERLEAMRAAAHLDLPFVTLDLEKEYKEGVIDYMIREYSSGRTPNPDVMCNREVKFGAFWDWAKKNGADFIATGHYAVNDSNHLRISKDTNKDQTYFLWTLTNKDLQHVLFPVGNMTKDEVRRLAKKFGLPNADKKDSQGLCFIGKVDVKEFLKHYIKSKPGKVVDETGKEIGSHQGAIFFTIGERHGFTITKKTPSDRPYYVVGKDITNNTVVVSNVERKGTDVLSSGKNLLTKSLTSDQIGAAKPDFEEAGGLKSSITKHGNVFVNKFILQDKHACTLESISWVDQPPSPSEELKARSRYRETLQDASISEISSGSAVVRFKKAQLTLTPGQSLVFYKDGECLGGGIIVQSPHE